MRKNDTKHLKYKNFSTLSCNMRLNLDFLVEKLWEHLNLIKIFTKKRGRKQNFLNYFL